MLSLWSGPPESNCWFSFASAFQLFLAVESSSLFHPCIHFNFYVLGDVALMSLKTFTDEFEELGSTDERITTDERSIVITHSVDITAKFAVSIKEKQNRLPTLYWLPKFHKRPYKARFIANSSSCTTTVLSNVLTLCLSIFLTFIVPYCSWY